MIWTFGKSSEANAIGVRPPLVACARRALVLSAQDFGIFEGLRDLIRQAALVAAHASRTMDSHHIPDDEGIGDALDLVPYILGRLQWQTPCALVVAAAMHRASFELQVPIEWGGVWDRKLTDLDPRHLGSELARYAERYHAKHPAVWIDGEWHQPQPLVDPVHFQTLRRAIH
jgi:peptidoglycan L-alanyl-D-glutamate endopeptidase CwlK